MPDRRQHRGLHPEDLELFAPATLPSLRAAAADLSWLYGRGYQPVSSLKLVGDRYALTERQRAAVARCACSDERARGRRARMAAPDMVAGRVLAIDGLNLLTTLEVALSGGVVLVGRDGVMRDIAGVHGSYRRVSESLPAIELVGELVQALGVARCVWLLDRPVSNSGRLCMMLLDHARTRELDWSAEVVPDPDPLLTASSDIVVSADGAILDAAATSLNLARHCIDTRIPRAFVVDLSQAPAG